MKTLMGYADKISLRAGETVAFKVSSNDATPYTATIVRLISGDTNPAGPGYQEEEVAGTSRRCEGRLQTVRPGSCLIIPSGAGLHGLAGFSLDMLIWPTTPQKSGQILASLWDETRKAGFILSLDGDLGLCLQLGNGSDDRGMVRLSAAVLDRHWYRVYACYDAERALRNCGKHH